MAYRFRRKLASGLVTLRFPTLPAVSYSGGEEVMVGSKPRLSHQLRNIVLVDESRLNDLIAQLPNVFGILDKAKFGIAFKGASLNFESNSPSSRSAIRKIHRLESFLARHGLINKARPRRMPPSIPNGMGYWWVKEKFKARKVIIPTPVLLEKFGVLALTIWVSDPKRISKPNKAYEWTGSFLYLPTVHFDSGKIHTVMSGCSALQF